MKTFEKTNFRISKHVVRWLRFNYQTKFDFIKLLIYWKQLIREFKFENQDIDHSEVTIVSLPSCYIQLLLHSTLYM